MKGKKVGIGIVALIVGIGVWLWTRGVKPPPPPPPPGKANLSGKVTHAQSGNPIAGVLVTLDSMSVSTDSGGNYAFLELEPGSYSGSASKENYETFYF